MQHLLKDMTDERVNLGSCSWDPHQVSPPEPVRGETDGGVSYSLLGLGWGQISKIAREQLKPILEQEVLEEP